MNFTAKPEAYILYWLRGNGGGLVASVQDPPTSGYQHALVMAGRPGYARVLCPIYLRTWALPLGCSELTVGYSSEKVAHTANILAKLSEPYFGPDARSDDTGVAEFLRAAGKNDDAWKWETRHKVVNALVLRDRAVRSVARSDVARSDVARSALLPGLKPGRKASVLEFFTSRGGTAGLGEAEKALGMSRNGVLTHLWGLRKKFGVEYALEDGRATVTLP